MNIRADQYITGDPAFAVDRHGSIVLWNSAAQQTFGYPNAEAMGKKCWELMCGHDVNGNRYCFEHCPLIEMAFLHEPVHGFHTSFENAAHQQKPYSVSCLTVFDEPGDEMLLHICHPEKVSPDENSDQTPLDTQPDKLSQREIEILALLAEKVKTQDIAGRLSISIRTVRTHIQHLMYKLRVHKRHDAILAAKRLNLI
ncbi:MAG: LuxR C-terminal-related transcriptional regulator [Xanthomonadales bacterium]|nr:LuxR C-terminal-related transcriptional regulator [Xanthomonadales bacterium]